MVNIIFTLPLLSIYATIGSNLEDLLRGTKDVFLPDPIEEAKINFRGVNSQIIEVCQYLKEVAQELNPQRINDYCEGACKYSERFWERLGQTETEGFVEGFN